jgi:hypothetical protein
MLEVTAKSAKENGQQKEHHQLLTAIPFDNEVNKHLQFGIVMMNSSSIQMLFSIL